MKSLAERLIEKKLPALQKAARCCSVNLAGILDLEDAWAWADGRGQIVVHSEYKTRGLLVKKGKGVVLEVAGRKVLLTPAELLALKDIEHDLIAEVYINYGADNTEIILVDVMLAGDKKLEDMGWLERRRVLEEIWQVNLIGVGRFDIVEVRYCQSITQLQDEVRWALVPDQAIGALLKTETGLYPENTSTPEWYQIQKDREPLTQQPVEKQIDSATLLAAAALGYKVTPSTEIKKEAPQSKVQVLKADEERQIVLGIVLEPLSVDAQEDIMIPRHIEDTAHDFLANHRVVGFRHKEEADAVVVESYIAPVDFELNGDTVKKGSWLLGVYIKDKDLWQSVKDGEINGFSIGGFGEREELT